MNQNTTRSTIHIHFSLSTEKINSELYKALLENEEIEMEMKSCCLTDAERARFPGGLAWAGQL